MSIPLASPLLRQRQRMNATGIGFAGIDGVWWLPATEPFFLKASFRDELAACGRGLFQLFDVITRLYIEQTYPELNRMLTYKVPRHLVPIVSDQAMLSVRPDFQLVPDENGYRPVATELEICPSAQGFAHAMQVGYGLDTDLVESFVQLLAGRDLLIVGTSHWSEFLFEQLALCQALAAYGVTARVLYDQPLPEIAGRVRREEQWRPPMFGVDERPDRWDSDILRRIVANGQQQFLWDRGGDWPGDGGKAVVFRFGYLDCFSAEKRDSFHRWERQGACFVNPPCFFLESKVMMAALGLDEVREQLGSETLDILHRCVPQTVLLEEKRLPELIRNKNAWAIKYAGFDQADQSWGGRSLRMGTGHSLRGWKNLLQNSLELPFPIVAQRVVPTARIDITYSDDHYREKMMRGGHTRLRAFLFREDSTAHVAGVHMTVSGGTATVSESTHAVQAPVRFA